MKRILLLALIGVGMVAGILNISLGSEAARTPESYPLVCRGAASLKIDNGKSLTWYVGFTFTRGTKPAGEGLAPGE